MRHLSLYLKRPVYASAGRRTPRPKRTQAPVDTVDNAGAHDLMTLRSASPVDAAGRVAAPSARSRFRLAITFTCSPIAWTVAAPLGSRRLRRRPLPSWQRARPALPECCFVPISLALTPVSRGPAPLASSSRQHSPLALFDTPGRSQPARPETYFPHFQQKRWSMRASASTLPHVFHTCGLSCGQPEHIPCKPAIMTPRNSLPVQPHFEQRCGLCAHPLGHSLWKKRVTVATMAGSFRHARSTANP